MAAGKPSPGQYGPYYLQELINSGGMADIWLATNQYNQTFSLRKLHDNLKFDFLAKRRFTRGCEILSKIHHHENIIGYLEHGKINGTHFLLMEYVEGTNLKILSARGDEIMAENIGNILIDMALGLEHIHDCGYMHLDFKPENVLVTRNAMVKLVDFDLSQPKPDAPKKLSRNPGTPYYMAPEQLLRRPLDHRADMFAYGATAYEILTGRKPFPGDKPKDILRRQLDRGIDFVPPREINPDIPSDLERIILKCLEKDMNERYPYTSVLVRDLQSALYV